MIENFIKTTNEQLKRDQNKTLESSFDDSQTLVEINYNQDF
jgi:hypothetical protein